MSHDELDRPDGTDQADFGYGAFKGIEVLVDGAHGFMHVPSN